MTSFDKLVELFRGFPGIGPRQAKRFAYHLIRTPSQTNRELSEAISNIKKEMTECAFCHRYFSHSNSKQALCSICGNASRSRETLMIVSFDSDLESVEKSDGYDGRYFVLGGLIPILEDDHGRYIRLSELQKSLGQAQGEGLKEIIVALSVTAEGDHTAKVLTEMLHTKFAEAGIKITTLGRGVSTGSELEYSDKETIRAALESRKNI